jgi:hypothetical protein
MFSPSLRTWSFDSERLLIPTKNHHKFQVTFLEEGFQLTFKEIVNAVARELFKFCSKVRRFKQIPECSFTEGLLKLIDVSSPLSTFLFFFISHVH